MSEKADEHDIRKQKEVLEETLQMIPDTKNRLLKACQDLQKLIEKGERDDNVSATEEFSLAKATLLQAPQKV